MKSFDICGKDCEVAVYPIAGDPYAGMCFSVPYEWGLASSAGAWFVLHPPKGTPPEIINEAKACLRRNRDVVSIRVNVHGS